MSQIKTKFIKDDAVTEAKVKLGNDGALRARNAADSADVELLKLDSSDVLKLLKRPQIDAAAPAESDAKDVVSKGYVDSAVSAEQTAREAGDSATLASAQAYTDGAVGAEQAAREAEDATFLKLDGSRPMTGDLNMDQHSIANAAVIEALNGDGSVYAYMESVGVYLQNENTSEVTQLNIGGLQANHDFSVSATGDLSLSAGGQIKAAAEVSMESHKIVGLSDGVDAGDAVNKGQLDLAISDEVSAREAGDAATLASANTYSDQKIADLVNSAPATLDTLKEIADALGNDPNLATTLLNEIGSVQSALTTEIANRTSADGVLDSKIDQEILDRQAAVLAEQTRAQSAESALDLRVDALEAASVQHVQQKFVLTSTDITNGYITLGHLAIGASINAYVDRLAIHETDDYTLSVVGGVTRITFAGELIVPSQEKLNAGDVVRVKFAKRAIV